MLKLTVEQLDEAAALAYRIIKCEGFKDEQGTPRIQIGGMIGTLPVPREAVNAAIHEEIRLCHEQLKAMGISLAPTEIIATPPRTTVDIGLHQTYPTPSGVFLGFGGKRR